MTQANNIANEVFSMVVVTPEMREAGAETLEGFFTFELGDPEKIAASVFLAMLAARQRAAAPADALLLRLLKTPPQPRPKRERSSAKPTKQKASRGRSDSQHNKSN